MPHVISAQFVSTLENENEENDDTHDVEGGIGIESWNRVQDGSLQRSTPSEYSSEEEKVVNQSKRRIHFEFIADTLSNEESEETQK